MTTEAMGILFEEYENLLYDRAWSFQESTGHDLDDLFGEAKMAFLKTTKKWDGKRHFGTLLWININRALIDYTRKTDVPMDPEAVKETGTDRDNPARISSFRDSLESLSAEARHVAELILNGPAEALMIIGTEPPRIIRGAVRRYLKSRGLSHLQANKTIRELKEMTNEYSM